MALKAAAAATCAWLVVLPFGGVADDYPYYAPLGAVIAISGTVSRSLRVSIQTVVAIVIGAVITAVVSQTPLPGALVLSLVVAAGVVVAGWKPLGSAGEWVPVAALFVLVIGDVQRADFVLAYIGLTGLGAAIGIAFNAAIPPLPLLSASGALAALRETLAGQLDDLADGLDQDEPPTRDEWQRREHDIGHWVSEMQRTVGEASEARRANWRAARWREDSDRQVTYGRALQRLALTVEDLTQLVVDREHRLDDQSLALSRNLRGPCASALRCTSELMRRTDEHNAAARETLQAAEDAVENLAESILTDQSRIDVDLFAAGSIVTALRRVIRSTWGTGESRST